MSETITITGNIATEPERRGNAAAITSFRLASTQRRFDKESGRWVDGHTNWYTVSAFRQLASHALESLHKGQRVIVTGRLRVRTWETAAGKGVSVDVEADAIGHDLRWGTSEFRRADASRPAAAEWEIARPADAAGDEWAMPMDDSTFAGPEERVAVAESTDAAYRSGSGDAPDRAPAFAGEQVPF